MKTLYAFIGLAGLVVFFKFMDQLSFWKKEIPILSDVPTGWLFLILAILILRHVNQRVSWPNMVEVKRSEAIVL